MILRICNDHQNTVIHSFHMLKSILNIDPQQTRTIVFTSSDDKEDWMTSTRIDNNVDQLVSMLEEQEELLKSIYHINSTDLKKHRLLLIINLLTSQGLLKAPGTLEG